MKKLSFDFHCHTSRSDAAPSQTPEVVAKSAAKANLTHLCITDHDIALPEDLRKRLERKYQIHLIGGCEFNGSFQFSTGRRTNVHVVVPWLDYKNPKIAAILLKNQNQNFEGYCKAMLRNLLKYGIDPSGYGVNASWQMVKAANPDSLHLGKNAIAHLLTDTGYCASPREAKDKYLSAFGERLAYVESSEYHHYVSLEALMAALNESGHIAILAHLFYYQGTEAENNELLTRFKELGGAGIEVEYGNYSREKKLRLAEIARAYDFLPSAASDRHEAESPFKLGNIEWYEALRERALALHGGRLAADD